MLVRLARSEPRPCSRHLSDIRPWTRGRGVGGGSAAGSWEGECDQVTWDILGASHKLPVGEFMDFLGECNSDQVFLHNLSGFINPSKSSDGFCREWETSEGLGRGPA